MGRPPSHPHTHTHPSLPPIPTPTPPARHAGKAQLDAAPSLRADFERAEGQLRSQGCYPVRDPFDLMMTSVPAALVKRAVLAVLWLDNAVLL